jgi:hypothetical protein
MYGSVHYRATLFYRGIPVRTRSSESLRVTVLDDCHSRNAAKKKIDIYPAHVGVFSESLTYASFHRTADSGGPLRKADSTFLRKEP